MISYNTTSGSSATPGGYTTNAGSSSPLFGDQQQTAYPQEYMNTDVRTDITQDTQVFTDVEESKDGDVDVSKFLSEAPFIGCC